MNVKHSVVLSVLFLAPLAAAGTLRADAEDGGAPAYPRPDLLVEPSDLAKADVAKGFVILDARERKKYDQGHVPGARWVDHAGWAKAFGGGKDVEGWSKRIGG